MESDRVEMSVGDGLVNGDHAINGINVNGAVRHSKNKMEVSPAVHMNGVREEDNLVTDSNSLQNASPELLQMISTESYLPMATLISRSAQMCWNDMTRLVEKLANISVPSQNGPVAMPGMPENNQSKQNLDKKDAFLNFASDHKAVFIKLLVLLQWSKRGDDVRKTIELNYWLVQRRASYWNATFMLGQMLQDLANAQVPNPDLYTAAEVLATGKTLDFQDLGYIPQTPSSPKQMLRTLKRLDYTLCTKLALETDVPIQLRRYHVHDGRVTFTVSEEFELDLSLMDDSSEAKFLMVDLRFIFKPAPSIPDAMHDELSFIVNSALDKEALQGAYDFVHDLTLSYKLSALQKQAQELSTSLWAGHLKVEMIRRTLVVQYWLQRPGSKSWLEIGLMSTRKAGQSSRKPSSEAQLGIRWFRDSKHVEEHEIILDSVNLSLENLLRQTISQHVNFIFNSIYDKFILTPLYEDGELELSQSVCDNDPSQCNLTLQLSSSDHLQTSIDTVTGAVVLGPAGDRVSRTQIELNRSKQLVDDFVSRISALRCVMAESNMLRTISNSGWEYLHGFKLNHSELKSMFGHNASRASFFRQRHWTSDWFLALTTSHTGDHWWLMRHSAVSATNDLMALQCVEVLKSRPLHLEGSISPTYMERLADYTSGVVVLQTSAQYLAKAGIVYKLPNIPIFTETTTLPPLQFVFDTDPVLVPADHKSSGILREISSSQTLVELSYHGIEQGSEVAVHVARARLSADVTVLSELAASQLDPSVAIAPDTQQVMIRSVSKAGIPTVAEVVSKLRHLSSIVACATTIKKSSNHTLESLSLSSLTILYNLDLSDTLRLVINFANYEHELETQFLPHQNNPHQYMGAQINAMLSKPGQSLSNNLEEVLALLRMTNALMYYLHGIQEKATEPGSSNLIRVHVLTRQAATYAIQYFASTEHFVRDTTDAETPKKLLARLEILPMKRAQSNMWVLRPAIEEFNAYTRPSYTSNALRLKIKSDIFSADTSPDWLPLDEGATCVVDKPEPILSLLHNSILQWLEEAVKPEKQAAQTNGVNPIPNLDGTTDVKPQPKQKTAAVPKSQPAQARPNGITSQAQGQRLNQNTGNAKNQPKMKQEVITLDD